MPKQLFIYETDCTDPYQNLAMEKYLMDSVASDTVVLYLWQNQNTVVIGRNQNAWAECRVSLLEQEGGKLARRLSGGGAVFHDMGNLNFTFLMNDEDYDLQMQLSVIQRACALLGIEATPSGRNDLLAAGCKFSGNAFYHSLGKAYHHGTLLIHADMDKLGRYLSPPKAKLQSKGVNSVRSRVINLSELKPGLTCRAMAQAMKEAFAQVYGLPASPLSPRAEAVAEIQKEAERLASWDWLYGKPLPFTLECAEKFPWGYLQLQLHVERGVIREAKVYTDAMDWALPQTLETALSGIRFTQADIEKALQRSGLEETLCRDLKTLLRKTDI